MIKIKYTKKENGQYDVYADDVLVGDVTKCESATRSFWYFDPNENYISTPLSDNISEDFGWKKWDSSRKAIIYKFFQNN